MSTTSSPEASPSTSTALRDEVEDLRGRVADGLKSLTAGRKALDALRKKGALDNILDLDKARRQLERADLSVLGLGDAQQALVARLGEHLQDMRRRARHDVLSGLRELARKEGVGFDVVGNQPPVVVMSPLTIELDPDTGKAALQYARETVHEVALDARSVFEGRNKAMQIIKKESVESPVFFDMLRAAYRMVLSRDGLKPGERVDLVDLLGPLSVLRIPGDRWRTVDGSKIDGYPRYLLAYQLQRLRRDGCLQREGARLELGTATGGSTRNKRNVLFVPVSPTDGQYYLSVRFGPAGG